MNEDPTKQDTTPNDAPTEVITPSSPTPETTTSAPETTTTPEPLPLTPVETVTPTSTPDPAQPEVQTQPSVLDIPTPTAGSPESPTPSRSGLMQKLIYGVVGLLVVAGIGFGAYHFGNNHGYTKGKSAETAAVTAAMLKVPAGATMVAQCAPGEGTQYVLPSDIPQGPIYNVWNGKVTGIEYMLAQSSIANSKTLNLALKSQQYNHVDVMYEPSGHAGFTEPHYHVVLSMISYADEQKITCGSSSSSTMM